MLSKKGQDKIKKRNVSECLCLNVSVQQRAEAGM